MVSNIRGLFFWCSLFTFSDTRPRTHEFQEFVEQNLCCQTSGQLWRAIRSIVSAYNYVSAEYAGLGSIKNSKKKVFAVTTMQPSSTFLE